MDDAKSKVLALLEEGLSNNEIAQRVGVSPGTVAAYKAHVTMGSYGESDAAAGIEEVESASNLKFGLERDMQEALRQHIDQLDPDLTIVDDGKERRVEAGFIDILAEDQAGTLVVIELKAPEAPDSAVTQVLSYIGSLQAETDQPVRGVLVARDFSPRVRLAARAAGIQVVKYGYSFTFTDATRESSEASTPERTSGP